MKYFEFSITGMKKDYDSLVLLLSDLGIETYQEESYDIIDDLQQNKKDWNYVDESVFQLEKDALTLTFYCSEVSDVEKVEKGLQKGLEEGNLGTYEKRVVEDQDWAEEWKKYYKPFSVGKHLKIIPSWEEIDVKEDDIIITLDPGMAFGSGTHETTYLCMEKLEEVVKPKDRVMDIGCGSGILSIVSALLGAKEVVGIDIDPMAIRVSEENAKLNGVDDICTFRTGNLMDGVQEKSQLIVSNIIAEIIVSFLDEVRDGLVDGGIFITSGIILEKKEMVKDALQAKGFQILEEKTQGEWAMILAEKK